MLPSVRWRQPHTHTHTINLKIQLVGFPLLGFSADSCCHLVICGNHRRKYTPKRFTSTEGLLFRVSHQGLGFRFCDLTGNKCSTPSASEQRKSLTAFRAILLSILPTWCQLYTKTYYFLNLITEFYLVSTSLWNFRSIQLMSSSVLDIL